MRGSVRAGFVGAALTVLLAGCGINTQKEGTPGPDVSQSTTGGSTVDTTAQGRLPKRAKGVVAVDGPVQGSLTSQVTGVGNDVHVQFVPQGESQGFGDLCAGRIDVLDTSRQISASEARLCRRNGVDLAQPLQVASDAVVIATPNEHDVGGDCLRMSTVNDIFRAGSPLTNWNQVGFFNIPLRVTGDEAASPAFQFFAQLVLGVDGAATLDDVRSDYIVRTTDDGVRREVTSAARLERVSNRFVDRLKDARDARDIAFQLAINRAIDSARRRMLDIFAREARQIAATQSTLTPTQKQEIARRNLRRINAAIRIAQERAIARFDYPRLRVLRARYRAAIRREQRLGTIGIFRFSYYELYEQQLRPMEIWDPVRATVALDNMTGVNVTGATATTTTPTTTTGTTATTTTGTTTTTTTDTTATTPTVEQQADGDVTVDAAQTPWCVFPSQQTITNGSYPLSRPFLLYVSKLNLQRDEVQAFLRTYLDDAQNLARRNRLVPIPEAVRTTNLGIIALDKTPGVADPQETTTTPTSTTTTEALPGVGVGTTSTTTSTTSTTPSTSTTSTSTTTP